MHVTDSCKEHAPILSPHRLLYARRTAVRPTEDSRSIPLHALVREHPARLAARLGGNLATVIHFYETVLAALRSWYGISTSSYPTRSSMVDATWSTGRTPATRVAERVQAGEEAEHGASTSTVSMQGGRDRAEEPAMRYAPRRKRCLHAQRSPSWHFRAAPGTACRAKGRTR